MTEPNWPTMQEVTAEIYKPGAEIPHWVREATRLAIDKCRKAWLVANDDPSQSPIGELRQDPGDSNIFAQRILADDASLKRWVILSRDGRQYEWEVERRVKGWPVIGAVPSTPAEMVQALLHTGDT